MHLSDVLVHVRPAAGGWVEESGDHVQALRFSSGARAEAQAQALADAISRAGGDARVVVHDRGDRVIGTRRYFANT